MILLPRYKDFEAQSPLIISPRMTGRFKFTAIGLDGRERPLTGWISNLVLDSGLNLLGTQNVLSYCHVGTSNTAATVGQTALVAWIAASSSIQETSVSSQASAPYYGRIVRRYRFNQGVATGNLNEVGVGVVGSNSSMWSRAVIVDEFGTPTTITVLATEVLDVTYELRLYPPLVDGGPVTINIAGVNYDVTWRAANVTGNVWSSWLGQSVSYTPSGGNTYGVYNGLMNASITGWPSGTSQSGSPVTAAYSNNSLQRDATVSFGLNEGNLSGGIKSTSLYTSVGGYQFQFNNPIPKDGTKTLTLTHRVSWSRYP